MLPSQLLKTVTGAELQELLEYNKIEPFGFLAEELRFASLKCHISNMMGGKKNFKFIDLDFMPYHPLLKHDHALRAKNIQAPKQTTAQMKEMLRMIHGKHGK